MSDQSEYEYKPLNKDGTCPEGCERVQDPNWKYQYDGCSVPKWLAGLRGIKDVNSPSAPNQHLFANEQHNGPCDKHDECYQTYNSEKDAKSKCDQAFLKAMEDACNKKFPEKKDTDKKDKCLKDAKDYYNAVKDWGAGPFEKRQKQVSKCLCKKQKPKPTNVKPQGRVKDKASAPHDNKVCDKCPHLVAGPAVQGSPNVFVNKRPALRVNSKGQHNASDSHNGTSNTWVAKTGSTSVFINGQPAHRMADATEHIGGGTGQLMEGSPNVLVG